MALPTIGWILTYQTLTKNILYTVEEYVNWTHLLSDDFSFAKLTKTTQGTVKRSYWKKSNIMSY